MKVLSGLALLCTALLCAPLTRATESGDEAQLANVTVMVSGNGVDHCAEDPRKCTSGAGIILGLDGSGLPLVYTARHLAYPEGVGGPIALSVRTKDGETIPATVHWQSSAQLDVLVLRLERAPGRTASWTCRRIAVIGELTSQTELLAIGAPNWSWSRLNRFNRANDKFVYIETPADKDGFSGGPVFVRGTLELVGLYQQGEEGIVRVARLDSLPKEAQPETLADSYSTESGSLGCRTTNSRVLASRDTTLRLGIGLAQFDAPIEQLASPIATLGIGQDAWLFSSNLFTSSLYASAQIGASYFDRGGDHRILYGQGLLSLGFRVGIGTGFLDALWAPGAYVLGTDMRITANSFRLALGRHLGDGVAGLVGGYVSRPGEPGIASLEIFSDFTLSSVSSYPMPGVKAESTGDPHIDGLLDRERGDKFMSVGGSITTASDRPFGLGGGVATFRFAPISAPFLVKRSLGMHLRETLEFQCGMLRLKQEERFFFAYTAELGLRTRFGLPNSLLLDLFYYLPVVTYYERFRFPLVGVGAGVGYKRDFFEVRAAYRYQITKAIYKSEPNLAFMGLSVQVDQ